MKKNNNAENLSLEEASDYWDEHDLSEVPHTEVKNIKFKIQKKKYVGLKFDLYQKLEKQAKKMKMSVDALVNVALSKTV